MLKQFRRLDRLILKETRIISVKYCAFSRKTKYSKKQDDDMFGPPKSDEDGEQENAEAQKKDQKIHDKIFVPKLPIKFDAEGYFELFQISARGKGLFFFQVPSYLINFFLGYHTMKYILLEKYVQAIFLGPLFAAFMTFSSLMSQQAGIIISKIELIENKDGDYAEQVRITNLVGEEEIVQIKEIKPLTNQMVKHYVMKQITQTSFPVFVEDLLMLLDKKGKIENNELFKAVLNGYLIDQTRTQTPTSDKDDDIIGPDDR